MSSKPLFSLMCLFDTILQTDDWELLQQISQLAKAMTSIMVVGISAVL